MLNRGLFLKASVAAMVAFGSGCLASGDSEAEDAPSGSIEALISAALPPPGPGLPVGTVVVPLPHFDRQPTTLRIPNATGFLQAYQLGRGSEAIVIINGGPGLDSTFVTRLHHGLAERLPGRRVLRYDQRGVGGSSPTTTAQNTITGAVDDVEAIRRALGVRKLHLVGQSFGGFVAGAYASTHPNNIASIAFVDPLPPLPADSPATTQGFDAINAHWQALIDAGILEPGSDDDPGPFGWNKLVGVYFADPLRVPIEVTTPAEDYDQDLSLELDADYSANGAPLVANLNRVRIPVLVVGGGVSGFGPTFVTGAVQAMSNSHPRVVIIPGAGHLVWNDKPAQTYGAISAFFNDCTH